MNKGVTDSGTSNTDATAGRVTKVGDFGLGVQISLNSSADLNLIPGTGFYQWTSSVPTNAPGGTANCDMIANGTSQYVFLRDASQVVWYRTWAGGSWQGWVALHHTGNIKRALGSDDNYPISQKAVADAIANVGQPSITGSASFNPANNGITLTGINTALAIEAGDVIQVTGSSSNNKIFTVDALSGTDTALVNIAHATYGGSLALVTETVSCTIKRVAKWHSAALGVGQALVDVSAGRAFGSTYTNSTGRPMLAYVGCTGTGYNGSYITASFNGGAALTVGANVVGGSFGGAASAAVLVPAGATYVFTTAGELKNYWNEVR